MRGGSEKTQLSTAFFFYFATLGLFTPYFPAYLRARGLDGAQIGWVMALSPLLKTFLPPIFGMLADRARGPRFWGTVAAWVAFVSLLLIWRADAPPALIVGVALYCAAVAPMIPLLDSSVLSWLRRCDAGRFGQIRTWGSFGYVLTAGGFGLLYPSLPPPLIVAALLGSHLLFALFLSAAKIADAPPAEDRFSFAARGAIADLLRDRRVWLLLAAIFFNRVGSSPYNAFFTVFVQDIKLGGDTVALSWGIGVATEILAMLFVDRLIDRWGAGRVLSCGVGLEAARWLFYAAIQARPALLAVAPLHGLAFAMLYVAGVRAMTEVAPRKLCSLAQGLAAAAAGAGQVIGFVGAGYLLEQSGGERMFLVGGLVGALSLAHALAFQRSRARE